MDQILNFVEFLQDYNACSKRIFEDAIAVAVIGNVTYADDTVTLAKKLPDLHLIENIKNNVTNINKKKR